MMLVLDQDMVPTMQRFLLSLALAFALACLAFL
jgi:hypothetical protein